MAEFKATGAGAGVAAGDAAGSGEVGGVLRATGSAAGPPAAPHATIATKVHAKAQAAARFMRISQPPRSRAPASRRPLPDWEHRFGGPRGGYRPSRLQISTDAAAWFIV